MCSSTTSRLEPQRSFEQIVTQRRKGAKNSIPPRSGEVRCHRDALCLASFASLRLCVRLLCFHCPRDKRGTDCQNTKGAVSSAAWTELNCASAWGTILTGWLPIVP